MRNLSAAAFLAATCLLILGWFDHHAAEYDPMHTHLAPGLLGIALDLRTISHSHAFAVEHAHGEKAAPPGFLVAGVTQQRVSAAVSLHATGERIMTAVLAASDLMKAARDPFGAIVPCLSLWFPAVDLDVPDPPPRSA